MQTSASTRPSHRPCSSRAALAASLGSQTQSAAALHQQVVQHQQQQRALLAMRLLAGQLQMTMMTCTADWEAGRLCGVLALPGTHA